MSDQITDASLRAMRSLAIQATDSTITTQGNLDLLVQHYVALKAENLKLREEIKLLKVRSEEVLINEQAALLRECRLSLGELLKNKPMLTGLICGSTTLGNLRAELYAYRPQDMSRGDTTTQT